MYGHYLFALIVLLACLTTCVGLINACASFTINYVPKLGYKRLVLLFATFGLFFYDIWFKYDFKNRTADLVIYLSRCDCSRASVAC